MARVDPPRGCCLPLSLPPLLLLLMMMILMWLPVPADGGICWTMKTRGNGKCTELIEEKVTREECCAMAAVGTAWSKDDLDSGALFFWRVLGGGVHCSACKASCEGVKCGEGRRCEVRKGQPRCVCSPDCRGGGGGGRGGGQRRHRGPVCGSDGRTYRSLCRLRKRACRRSTALTVAYDGHCQKIADSWTKLMGSNGVNVLPSGSCERLRCPTGKHCLLDQNLRPHCVKCATRRCPKKGHAVCGSDGVSYPSPCHLRSAACLRGRAIPEAYRGPCKPAGAVSCGAVKCRERQACLVEPATGSPRCVTCSYRCPKSGHLGGPICGSNNITYPSWCHMLKDACDTGYVLETRFAGRCDRPHENSTLEAAEGSLDNATEEVGTTTPEEDAGGNVNRSSSGSSNGSQSGSALEDSGAGAAEA